MSWFYLFLAGLLEAVWAVGLKYTEGFSRLWPSLLVGTAVAGSMFLLALAVRTIPIATAYAVWVGIGIIGTSLSSPLVFREPLRPVQGFLVAVLLIAIVGLKLAAKQTR